MFNCIQCVRDRAGVACPEKLDSWCGLDRFGIGRIYYIFVNLARDGCVGETRTLIGYLKTILD